MTRLGLFLIAYVLVMKVNTSEFEYGSWVLHVQLVLAAILVVIGLIKSAVSRERR